ncbi:mechanosensitive ion channel domain-containing protein [uncultured Flavobacterium sp.]|uniref:mechanosensitive ion channel family protein n=1 Tax=uncultured Flavobacterium sp. TaxID=165435 RepID=UPI0030EF6E40|tara:strand:- start:69916 stop:70758 length:843 start_codon:yes stop_codon:yes gene_type:complete
MDKLIEKFQFYYDTILQNAPTFLIGLVVLIIGFAIANFGKKVTENRIKSKVQNTLSRLFIAQIISGVIKIITVVIFLDLVGFQNITTKILAGAGILTFVVGFAFKDIGENFLAGILLAFKSPFKENDLIETEKVIGYVKELRIRETIIKTTDGKDVFVPNSQIINSPLINYTIDGFLRNEFLLGLDYSSDLSKAIQVIIESVSKTEGVLLGGKKPAVIIDEFAASTINLRVLFWLDTFKSSSKSYHLAIRTQVMKNVLLALTENEFSLPSNIVEVKQYEG